MSANQSSRLGFLKLVVIGTALVPLLGISGGATVFEVSPPEAAAPQAAQLLQVPPPIVLVALGLTLVAGAVGRRVLKSARG